MAKFQVTHPSGQFEVEAESPEEANKQVDLLIKEENATKVKSDYEAQPEWSKPFTAVNDMARIAGNAATMYQLDKWLGPEAQQATQDARVRAGFAGDVADVGGQMALPTGVGTAVARVGGGPIVRGVTGLLTGGATGAAQGGVSAYGQDQPVVPGALQGGAAGMLGQGISGLIGKGTNAISKWWKGVDDSLPAASTKNVPGKAPNAARRIEHAISESDKAGGKAGDVIRELKNMNQNKLPADILADIRSITNKDLGTKGADLVSKAGYAMGGAAPFTGFHSIPLAVAQAVTGPAVGASAKFAANQGTLEAAENLRRKLLKMPKFQGPLTKEMVEKLSRANRGAFRSALDED